MTGDIATVLLLAMTVHCVTVYALVKLCLTGKGIGFVRRAREERASHEWESITPESYPNPPL